MDEARAREYVKASLKGKFQKKQCFASLVAFLVFSVLSVAVYPHTAMWIVVGVLYAVEAVLCMIVCFSRWTPTIRLAANAGGIFFCAVHFGLLYFAIGMGAGILVLWAFLVLVLLPVAALPFSAVAVPRSARRRAGGKNSSDAMSLIGLGSALGCAIGTVIAQQLIAGGEGELLYGFLGVIICMLGCLFAYFFIANCYRIFLIRKFGLTFDESEYSPGRAE